VHHWLGRRVKAHVFLCMLAYYVEHHMRSALAPILFVDHQPPARERASIVAPAQPSPAAIEKRTKRHAADGTQGFVCERVLPFELVEEIVDEAAVAEE
jgi:hypothetical protein